MNFVNYIYRDSIHVRERTSKYPDIKISNADSNPKRDSTASRNRSSSIKNQISSLKHSADKYNKLDLNDTLQKTVGNLDASLSEHSASKRRMSKDEEITNVGSFIIL
jgi:hypothetical protein